MNSKRNENKYGKTHTNCISDLELLGMADMRLGVHDADDEVADDRKHVDDIVSTAGIITGAPISMIWKIRLRIDVLFSEEGIVLTPLLRYSEAYCFRIYKIIIRCRMMMRESVYIFLAGS